MKKQFEYSNIVEEAAKIGIETVNAKESIDRIGKKKDELLSDFEKNKFVKVPFVGDFSAGKSSLLNALMGTKLLPTDVLPTTAVSYELYYSMQEQLKVFHRGELKETAQLSQISSLKVVPGDVVYVYINNQFVRDMNERGIIIVDMPGIDSGIEAHNNAILNYLSEGSFFFLVSDAEQGTLRRSAINFVDEIKRYGMQCNVVISKADKKAKEDVEKVRTEVEAQAKRIIRDDIEVAVTSAARGELDELRRMLDELDADKMFCDKYSKLVSAYVSDIIGELQLQIKLAQSSKKDFTDKIEALKREHEKALDNLRRQSDNAQSLESSADDILEDVRQAIVAKSAYLANLIYTNKNNSDVFNNELLSTIRPVLVNSFKREISEYQDVLGGVVKDFAIDVNDIFTDKNEELLDTVIDKAVGKEAVEAIMKKGFDKLLEQLSAYKGLATLLGTLSKILSPVIVILINFLPDVLKLIFGKSKQQKLDEIRNKVVTEVATKVIDALRQPVMKMLQEQRHSALKEMEALINEESRKYDDNVNAMLKEQHDSEEEIAVKMQNCEAGINELNQLIASI